VVADVATARPAPSGRPRSAPHWTRPSARQRNPPRSRPAPGASQACRAATSPALLGVSVAMEPANASDAGRWGCARAVEHAVPVTHE
jgi:hypothetical protein